MNSGQPLVTLEQARQLVAFLEQGAQEEADQLITEMCSCTSSPLFECVGQLTRQLHDSLADFQLDSRIQSMAREDIPDARERLNYVITMTDQAANRTMDAVEASLPIADSISGRLQEVMPGWNALMDRKLALGEFKVLCHRLDGLLKHTADDADQLRSSLTDILMAQDFQDLTGQMIRKVIGLVHEIETKLVEMLLLFGEPTHKQVEKQAVSAIAPEGPIINKEQRTDVVANQDDVDDLLSSLGF